MSRSQKNARLKIGPIASQGGAANKFPAELTEKDGAANIAGDVTKFNTDNYGPEVAVPVAL